MVVRSQEIGTDVLHLHRIQSPASRGDMCRAQGASPGLAAKPPFESRLAGRHASRRSALGQLSKSGRESDPCLICSLVHVNDPVFGTQGRVGMTTGTYEINAGACGIHAVLRTQISRDRTTQHSHTGLDTCLLPPADSIHTTIVGIS